MTPYLWEDYSSFVWRWWRKYPLLANTELAQNGQFDELPCIEYHTGRNRQLLLLVLVLLALLVGGCAFQAPIEESRDMRYHWTTVPDAPPITTPPLFVVVDYEQFVRRCKGFYTACAERRYDLNPPQCWIVSYYDIRGSGYIEWHEKKHCLGYNHY